MHLGGSRSPADGERSAPEDPLAVLHDSVQERLSLIATRTHAGFDEVDAMLRAAETELITRRATPRVSVVELTAPTPPGTAPDVGREALSPGRSSPPPAPAEPSPRRHLAWVVPVAALILITSGAAGAWAWFDREDTSAGESALPGSPAQRPQPPEGAPPVGSFIEVRLRGDGSQVVTQWIALREERRSFRLALGSGRGSGISRVTVDTAGRETSDGSGRARGLVSFDEPVRSVRVRYVVRRPLERSPTTPTRSLATVATRPALTQATGPVVVRVSGGTIRGLACQQGDRVPQPCGRPAGAQWQVRLGGATSVDTLQVQTDLPDR